MKGCQSREGLLIFHINSPSDYLFLSPNKFLSTSGNPHEPCYDGRTNKAANTNTRRQNAIGYVLLHDVVCIHGSQLFLNKGILSFYIV